MRERPLLLLLDEPTVALDPEAEHRLYEQYAAAAKMSAAEIGGGHCPGLAPLLDRAHGRLNFETW